MELGSRLTPAHDFAYRDFAPRFADPPTLARPAIGRIANGHLRTLARNAVDPAGPTQDAFRPSSRAARLLDHVPLYSSAPGAADRIVQALGDDSEVIEKFLRALELLEPFGPGLVRAFIKAVARGIERAGQAAVPPEPVPAPAESVESGEFSFHLTRLDFRLEVFSASSELRSGPDGFSYTQNVQYARIQVSFLSLSATGSFSREIDPLQIEIEGDAISAAGLDLESVSAEGQISAAGGESSLAPGVRAAILHAANQINVPLRNDPKHIAGADDTSPIVPRPPAHPAAASIHEFLNSLMEGFTPKLRLHI